MTHIRIDTEHVRDIGRLLVAQGDRLTEIGHVLQRAVEGLNTTAWDGRSRHQAEPLLDRVRPESTHVAEMLDLLGRKLLHVAETFEHEDTTAARNLDGMSWVDFEAAGGQVLGVATAVGAASTVMLASMDVPSDEYRLRDISKMPWSERLRYAELLPEQIQSLEAYEKHLQNQIAQDGQEIEDIDRQLQVLRAQRAALQEEADDWRNKIKPDDEGLRWGFDDGFPDAPWRTVSDNREDQIADLDQQIAALEERKASLAQRQQENQAQVGQVHRRLGALRQQQEDLNQVIDEGISSSTTPAGKRAGCVLYVSEHRDISDFNGTGTPSNWDTRAVQKGYDTGTRPVKGAVMVYDGDTLPKDSPKSSMVTWKEADGTKHRVSSAGHVEYVTDVRSVEREGQTLYEVDVSGAGTQYKDGKPVWNTYVGEYKETYLVDPENLPDGVWFLYDKSPTSSDVSAI